jgi:ADP-ribose pyrophosphatase YjhB (NUDIX family)
VTKMPQLLEWARSLQAIAQSGLAWEPDAFDQERYAHVRRVAAEMLARSDGLDASDVEVRLAQEWGHATPKLDVRGAVFRDGQILLVQERRDRGWSLPGGWADVGESPGEAACREVLEESGFRTQPVKLIGLYERDRHAFPPHQWHIWKAVFLCELVGEMQETPDGEIVDARFFGRDELPGLRYSRASEWQIDRCFAHRHDPGLPTEFD